MSDRVATLTVMDMMVGVGECGEGMERKPASYADLEALPDTVVGEIVAGTLYASPRPAMPHTLSASRLGMRVG